MADLKISQLTSATTPLAGTEVLPIVQSSSTKKVATDDLTVKNVRSNATTGILQIAGPAAAATRVMTTPDANFTAARTDAPQSFTGDQTLSTGNLIQGTAAKGFNFSANTSLAGKSSTLLNWYEEGYYTASMTADTGTITLSYARLNYTRAGRMVTVSGELVVSALSSPVPTGGLYVNLPFTAAASSQRSGRTTLALGLAYTFTGAPTGQLFAYFDQNATTMELRTLTNFVQAQFAQYLAVGTTFDFGFTYQCQ